MRSGIAAVLLAIGYCALARSAAVTVARADPNVALRIWGNDARIMASAAQRLVELGAEDTDRQKAVALAQRALLRDGTAVLAADTLGFSAGFANNEKLAAQWFAYSERLSRRDLRAQLYFIENAVSQGDINTALHHYDIALRTSEVSAPTTLFPVLRAATSDQVVRRELAKTLAANPIWANSFLIDLTNNGPDFAAAAQLLTDIHRLGAPISTGLEAALLNNLVSRNNVGAAWRFYVELHPEAGRSLVRNGQFKTTNVENSPFDWQLPTNDGVSVELGVSNNRNVLDYRLSPTVTATVVRQLIFLQAGKYRLDSVVVASSHSLNDGSFWQVTCQDGRQIGKLEMGGPVTTPRRFSTEIGVPPGCPVQSIVLIVRASDDVAGATGQLGSIAVSRVPQ